MTLNLFKILSALLILLIALIGGIWPFIKRFKQAQAEMYELPAAEAMATGIFFGAAMLHMLPDAVSEFQNFGYVYPFPFLIVSLSFLLLLLLEHIGTALKDKNGQRLASIALITLLMLSIHSLFEGAAVGMSHTLATTFIIFVAIAAHKGAEGFALATTLNRSQLSFTACVIAFIFFELMTPLGILGGSWIMSSVYEDSIIIPIFSSLAAGAFLYIGTLHGLDRASLIRHCCNMREFGFMMIGFSIMALVRIWA
jgi:zinc transporter ZupT